MELLGLNLCLSNQDWTQVWGLVARRTHHVWRVSRLVNMCQFGDSGALRECGSSAPFSPHLALCISPIRLFLGYILSSPIDDPGSKMFLLTSISCSSKLITLEEGVTEISIYNRLVKTIVIGIWSGVGRSSLVGLSPSPMGYDAISK